MVPLGFPVVPEVKASSATSSEAVSHVAEVTTASRGALGQLAERHMVADRRGCDRRRQLIGGQSEVDAGGLTDDAQLNIGQLRRSGHRDESGPQHRQPGGDQQCGIGAVQENPVAWNEALIVDKHVKRSAPRGP